MPVTAERIYSIRNASLLAKARGESERTQGDWSYSSYGSHIDSYDETFGTVLEMPISEYLRERKQSRRPCNVIDLLSPGQAIRDLVEAGVVDKGLAVTLGDGRTEEQRLNDTITVETGDILKKPTWSKVSNWRIQNNIDGGVDAIICRGRGALLQFPNNPSVMLSILQRMWDNLTFQEGLILAQVNLSWKDMQLIESWSRAFNRYHKGEEDHCVIRTNRGASTEDRPFHIVKLYKTSDSPRDLLRGLTDITK